MTKKTKNDISYSVRNLKFGNNGNDFQKILTNHSSETDKKFGIDFAEKPIMYQTEPGRGSVKIKEQKTKEDVLRRRKLV